MIDRMQELLEAERAGVRCLAAMAIEAPIDEGRFCAGLCGLLRARGAAPHAENIEACRRYLPAAR